MPYDSLADFLEELAQHGELARITAEVDPLLEVAEITRRVARASGPALLFDRVKGQSVSLVTNLLGTTGRVCRALQIESLDEIFVRTEALIQKNTPQNWFDRLKMVGDDAGAGKFRPRTVKSGPCGQVVRLGRDIDLAALPLVKQWPAESGPSLTAGQLITQDRAGGERQISLRPLQALDQNRLAVIDEGHSAFARHWNEHQQAGEKMPVAVALGGDPASIVAASCDLPEAIDIYHGIGLLRGRAIDVVKCRTHTLEVPAEADLVLEGYVDPATPAVNVEAAGAGGGYSRSGSPSQVLHVTAITHRTHTILPALVDAGQYGEMAALLAVRERMLLPALRTIAPEIVDLHLPNYGGLYRYAFVSIRKAYPFHARQIASALWGSPALRFAKFLILVDASTNVHDVGQVLSAVGANAAPERDLFSHEGPAHGSDHANTLGPLARHLGIDATTKIAGERTGSGPTALVSSAEIEEMVTARWPQYGLDARADRK